MPSNLSEALNIAVLGPNCLNSTLYLTNWGQICPPLLYKNRRDYYPHYNTEIRWSGLCAKCGANVQVEGAKTSVIIENINTQALQTENDKLSKENQDLKDQLAKIKELAK